MKIQKLPIEIQNKIFFYYAEHPTARIIKENIHKSEIHFYFKKHLKYLYIDRFYSARLIDFWFNIIEDENNNPYEPMF